MNYSQLWSHFSHRRYIYISILAIDPTYFINVYGEFPTSQKKKKILYAFILLIGEEDICIGVDGIIFVFDWIILQHVTSNLAIFTCLAHNYIIFWPQMQTNINTKL